MWGIQIIVATLRPDMATAVTRPVGSSRRQSSRRPSRMNGVTVHSVAAKATVSTVSSSPPKIASMTSRTLTNAGISASHSTRRGRAAHAADGRSRKASS